MPVAMTVVRHLPLCCPGGAPDAATEKSRFSVPANSPRRPTPRVRSKGPVPSVASAHRPSGLRTGKGPSDRCCEPTARRGCHSQQEFAPATAAPPRPRRGRDPMQGAFAVVVDMCAASLNTAPHDLTAGHRAPSSLAKTVRRQRRHGARHLVHSQINPESLRQQPRWRAYCLP